MTNAKTTKRALLASVMAMLLCFTMLIGTTYAWFTDEVVSNNNIIKSGTLDMELYWSTNASSWEKVADVSNMFSEAFWEPGHTEVVYLKVANEGSLAFKYNLGINIVSEETGTNVYNEPFKLSNYIEFGVIETSTAFADRNAARAAVTNAKLISAGYTKGSALMAKDTGVSEEYIALVVYMPETVGNEANHKSGTTAPAIKLGINVVATQFTYEEDSYNNTYDENAEYPSLEKVIESGATGGVSWELTDAGTLRISPASSPAADTNSGKEFDAGQWREAVIYNSSGGATAIGGYPYDVNAVTSLEIADGVTSIGSFTAKFPNLTGEVVIPASVTYIGQEAFQNTKITKLTFEEGGTEPLCIAPGAFKKMNIEEIVFPADRPAIHIHCWAFNDCTSLKRVTLTDNITTFSGWTHVEYMGMNYSSGGDSQIFARCTALESITFTSQAVHDRFFAASGNRSNINAIGGVEIIVKN